MTVQDLIDELTAIKNKDTEVIAEDVYCRQYTISEVLIESNGEVKICIGGEI